MFGFSQLKGNITVTEDSVKCPVLGCGNTVARQRKNFKRREEFKCREHQIFISPSTFEYQNELLNLLWRNDDDLNLLAGIKKVKRESRMSRDNSEDSVSFNVFRYLERNDLLSSVIGSFLGVPPKSPEVIYWSYSWGEDGGWSKLNDARITFGEQPSKGSEPDIIIYSKDALLFIEAKLTAGNKTRPSEPAKLAEYAEGGDRWASEVCRSSCQAIAIDDRKYELLRFWLLGTWLAQEMKRRFYLVNLVCSGKEEGIEADFGEHINAEAGSREFRRITWEDIYRSIKVGGTDSAEKIAILDYFREKTIGYGRDKQLQRAFRISDHS
jgi:hypothetical protein